MNWIICVLCFCASVNGLHVRDKKSLPDTSLKQWLSDGKCFNVVLTPQYNNQHSMFGITEFLRKENLLQYLGGVAAGSGGSLPGAFLAAGGNFSTFAKHFPKKGWGGFGPSEPKITEDYERFLNHTLPRTFEELKYPLGLSLTHWESLEDLKKFDRTKQVGFAISSGLLHEAMIAAVTTSGQDPTCPKCKKGFWPRRIHDKFPVTDGAFGDIWGSVGLMGIPSCTKVLHLLPLDYPQQVEPPALTSLPKIPREMVSLIIVQPPVASHSYIHEALNNPLMKLLFRKSSQEWNKLMFDTTHHAMPAALREPLKFSLDGSSRKQASVTLDPKQLTDSETLPEQIYDRFLSLSRDNFWVFYSTEGKSAWGDMQKTSNIVNKLQMKHYKRLLNDVIAGEFGPHKGK